MKQVLAIVLLSLVASALGGSVPYERCGGVGTLLDFRVDTCDGAPCYMTPGIVYATEADLIPSSASAQLRLKVTTTFFTGEVVLIDSNLQNSSVQPGQLYTITFSIVPNDILAGSVLPIRAEISDLLSGRVEYCAHFQVAVRS